MWKPAVSGMEKAHNCADLSYRRIRRYSVWRLKRLEARDFSHVRIKFLIHMNEDEKITAFRELIESIKENSKYLSEDFNPDTELEKGKKEKYSEIVF